MQPKPENFSTYYAESFKDRQVVAAYRHRPPYPQEVFPLLDALVVDEPRVVLDVGAGSGDIARQLVESVERVDAVDFSQSMLEEGKRLPNGQHERLHWIYGKVEDAPLSPPYALITAGSSIHWPAWEIAFPRFRAMLTPRGVLALIYRHTLPMPWDAEVKKLLAPFANHQGHKGSNAVKELEARGYFQRRGAKETAPVPFSQTLDDYIEGLHSRSHYARERIGREKSAELDRQIRALLLQFHPDGVLPLQVVGSVTWGQPEEGIV